MTLSEFKNWALAQGSVAKYDDGQFRGECVSLVNQYCHRVLGVPAGAWGNAGDWATNSNVAKYFDKVSNIQAGDILVYPHKAAPYGHIAIALNGSQMLDQNGDYGRKVAVRNIWANPVILRRKGGDMITSADKNRLRVINSEIKGWNFAEVHSGKYDAREVGAWSGQTWQKAIDQAWREGEAYRKGKAAQAQKIADLQKALANEKNKPPQTVIKEVEKIVEKIVKVEVPVVDPQVKEDTAKTREMVTTIFNYFSDRWATFKNYIKK